MTRSYKIFNQIIRLNTVPSSEGDLLHSELSLYETEEGDDYDIELNYVSSLTAERAKSSNPSIHRLFPDGFQYTMGPVSVRINFDSNKVKQIDFCILHSGFVKRTINKALNIQFTNHKQAIGQWVHEYILVPLCFLNSDLGVVHSSAVKSRSGKTLLFGGTGGVGKTSLELEFCRNQDATFIADDISIVDSEGMVYPNLSYPKVYGYNMVGSREIKAAIFKNRNILDRFFFWLHGSLRGMQYVRRRVSPDVFYGKVDSTASPIEAYFILARMDVTEVALEEIDTNRATELTELVISREYGSFFDHLVWSQYNASLIGDSELVSYEEILKKNSSIVKQAFSQCEKLYLLKIPMKIEHQLFKESVVKLLGRLDLI